jgi:NAD(P)-dependent dehydrogenase (short-subunit alcohol dehydrogenase family)
LYRYVVALDGFMFKYCQELAKDGIKIRCARSTSQESTTTATSEEEEDDREFSPGALAAHMSGRWAETNSVVSRGNNVWALDVDVAILDVPPLAEAMAAEGGACDVLYQRRWGCTS